MFAEVKLMTKDTFSNCYQCNNFMHTEPAVFKHSFNPSN